MSYKIAAHAIPCHKTHCLISYRIISCCSRSGFSISQLILRSPLGPTPPRISADCPRNIHNSVILADTSGGRTSAVSPGSPDFADQVRCRPINVPKQSSLRRPGWSQFGRLRAKFDRHRPHLGEHRNKCGRFRAVLHRKWPMSAQHWPTLAQKSPIQGKIWLKFGPHVADLGQKLPGLAPGCKLGCIWRSVGAPQDAGGTNGPEVRRWPEKSSRSSDNRCNRH